MYECFHCGPGREDRDVVAIPHYLHVKKNSEHQYSVYFDFDDLRFVGHEKVSYPSRVRLQTDESRCRCVFGKLPVLQVSTLPCKRHGLLIRLGVPLQFVLLLRYSTCTSGWISAC